jgi:hypothetical protein
MPFLPDILYILLAFISALNLRPMPLPMYSRFSAFIEPRPNYPAAKPPPQDAWIGVIHIPPSHIHDRRPILPLSTPLIATSASRVPRVPGRLCGGAGKNVHDDVSVYRCK